MLETSHIFGFKGQILDILHPLKKPIYLVGKGIDGFLDSDEIHLLNEAKINLDVAKNRLVECQEKHQGQWRERGW